VTTPKRAIRTLGLAGLVLLAACTTPGSSSAPPTSGPPVVDRPAAASPVLETWAKGTELGPSQTNFFVEDVLAGDAAHPWLAVGFELGASGFRQPIAWESPDGAQWERHPMVATEADPSRDRPVRLARLGSRAVAVGYARLSGTADSAVSWVEGADGEWVPAGAGLETARLLEGLGVVGDRFVAVGSVMDGLGEIPALFTSADGRTWDRVPDGTPPLVPLGSLGLARDVASGLTGAVVVGGVQAEVGGDLDAAVWRVGALGTWRSVDTATADLAGPGTQELLAVAPFEGRFVAAGQAIDGGRAVPAAWTSPDGLEWSRTDLGTDDPSHVLTGAADSGSGAGGSVVDLATGEGGVVAVGVVDGRHEVWRSTDGRHWDPQPLDDAIAGSAADQGFRVATDGTRTVVVVQGPNQARLWTQAAPGEPWEDVTTEPAFPPVRPLVGVTALARSRDVTYAAGYRSIEHRDGTPGMSRITFWRTGADGAWEEQPAEPVTGGGPSSFLAWRDGAVVVADGVLWHTDADTAKGWVAARFADGRPLADRYLVVSAAATPTSVLALAWTGQRSVLLSSDDGSTFTEVDAGIRRGDTAVAVCADATGAAVLGYRPGANPDGDDASVLWLTDDGSTWHEVFDLVVTGAPMWGSTCTKGPKGIVVTGADRDAGVLAFVDADGLGSSRIDLTGVQVDAVCPSDDGFLVVGARGSGLSDADVALAWVSDGHRWGDLPDPEGALASPGLQRGVACWLADDGTFAVGGELGTGATVWSGLLAFPS
jgi:hypothetical protein